MEYLEAGSVADLIKESGPLDEKSVAYVLSELLLALEYLHSERKIHRDVKVCTHNSKFILLPLRLSFLHSLLSHSPFFVYIPINFLTLFLFPPSFPFVHLPLTYIPTSLFFYQAGNLLLSSDAGVKLADFGVTGKYVIQCVRDT